jgi:NAD(P)-dependent dehydrogenase (short-subunit alcohol dehydrogenase family)
VVTGRDAARGAAVVDTVRAKGGEATFVAHELDGSADGSRALAAEAATVFGPIEILVNNAGIYPPEGTLAIDEATFDRIVGVNVKAPYFLTAAIVPSMAAGGRGVVINLGSWGARLGIPAGTAYASTKGAMETLTRAWAAEFGPLGIRVNAISPGVTFEGSTPTAKVAGPMMATTPLGGLVSPDSVARAAVFLASEDASDIHGTVLDVDGGRSSVLFAAR